MYTEDHDTESTLTLDQRCRSLLKNLLEDAPTAGEPQVFECISNVFTLPKSESQVFVICTGTIERWHHNRLIYTYQEGDMLGLDHQVMVDQGLEYKLSTEFPVRLQAYERHDLMSFLCDPKRDKQWLYYLTLEISRRDQLLSAYAEQKNTTSPGFVHYPKGSVIIEEGTVADRVFSIVEGTASVTFQGQEVGTLGSDEIFGALSLLTNNRRSATVTATSDCSVTVVPMDQFESHLQSHPQMCINLMREMAQQIIQLNAHIIKL